MVGRMFREAVENLIDDVKDSIEEQGRSAGHRRMQPPPMPHLEHSPNLELPSGAAEPPGSSQPVSPSGASVAAAPVASAAPPAPAAPARVAPARVAPAPAPEPTPTPIETADTPEPENVPDDDVTFDHPPSADATAELTTPPAVLDRAEADLARLEADCDAARELYRESRAELRAARRLARVAARDERRDRRYERRFEPEVDDVT